MSETRHKDGVALGLIGRTEVDVGLCFENERVVTAGTTVYRSFRAVIVYSIGAGAGVDRIRAAAAVDGVVACARRDRIGA